jgi:predicted aspartyl protease
MIELYQSTSLRLSSLFNSANQEKIEIFTHRPRVEIRLSNGQQNIKLPMLVDSGADITLIPLEVAEILGLELGKEIRSTSASGTFVTRETKVKAQLLKGVKSYDLGLMDVRVPIDKIEGSNLQTYALLGRSHFFMKFDITFRENMLKILLRKPKKH